MRWKLFPVLIVFLMVPACSRPPFQPCGWFTSTDAVFDTPESNGIDMTLSFDFDAAQCGSACPCDPVCYIQIVRTVDMENFTYLYQSSEKEDRATSDGWYIDRLEGKIWGYYGRNDDGTFAGRLDPGSETDPAILFDGPRRGEAEPWLDIAWMAVSVPVCIDEDSECLDNLLGYYSWSWRLDDTGVVTESWEGVAWPHLQSAVDEAVVEWNDQAPGLGKNPFPAFTHLTPQD